MINQKPTSSSISSSSEILLRFSDSPGKPRLPKDLLAAPTATPTSSPTPTPEASDANTAKLWMFAAGLVSGATIAWACFRRPRL